VREHNMTGQEAVRLRGLTKRYKEVTAVDSLDLTVRSGEIYGFLGRNGAGKTTTIRMMLGLISPSEGTAELFGRSVTRERAGAVTGAGSLVETATAYPTLTVRENLELHRLLRGSPRQETDRVMELLCIADLANRRAGRLSLGNRQRLALARALIGQPRLLVLDEPSNGLDPAGIAEIRGLLRELASGQGITVFVSSHILGEVSLLADRIGIIHRGKLIEEFSMEEWKARETDRWRAVTADDEKAEALLKTAFPDATVTRAEEGIHLGRGSGAPEGELKPELIAERIVRAGIGLRSLIPLTEDLETRFLKLTGDE